MTTTFFVFAIPPHTRIETHLAWMSEPYKDSANFARAWLHPHLPLLEFSARAMEIDNHITRQTHEAIEALNGKIITPEVGREIWKHLSQWKVEAPDYEVCRVIAKESEIVMWTEIYSGWVLSAFDG